MNPNQKLNLGPTTTPWWQERMMWLVVGGPAVVVVAALITGAIAVRGADVVVLERPVRAAAPDASTPAVLARNHAATPPVGKPAGARP